MGGFQKNIEVIAHRNPGTATDWRLRLHHGAANLDEESPRIADEDRRWLSEAAFYNVFEQRIADTGWAEFWAWLPPDARLEIFQMLQPRPAEQSSADE